ncbi:type II toxin-antitoxin system PemK/MazF family toxin [Nitrosomonas ureae]|uniref:mRNA interferase n=1 Tax=Nitrosomonas ureae TaxID=44577 RepID=A0A286AM62_9PROT|nr:type II toxin-antitoxin system PemK/MazF family toxin [Nitrosomonas ureae]SOD22985.1 mRNA interferase MazF [Nitrosomonas ureae]
MNDYRYLEIYWVDLEPARGAETKKFRPCVILQGQPLNVRSKTFIVAPLLTNHKNWDFAVNIMATQENGLDKDRHINLKQMRVVDISRMGKKQGGLETKYLSKIKRGLSFVFDLGRSI